MAVITNSYCFMHSINGLVSAIETECVYCEVNNKSLNVNQVVFFL